jgi:hypothetical protein
MVDWLTGVPMWLAAYLKGVVMATWAQLNSAAVGLGNLALPKNVTRAIAWQFFSSFTGVHQRMDVSQFLGEFEGQTFEDYLSGVVAPAPAFVPWSGIIASWATPHVNIRSTPSAYAVDLGDVLPNAPVTIIGEQADANGTKNPATGKVYTWGQITVPVTGWIRLDFVVKG